MANFIPYGFMAGAEEAGGEIVTTSLQHWYTCLDSNSMTGTSTWVDLQGNRDLNLTGISQQTLGGVTTLYDSGGGGYAQIAVYNTTIASSYTVEAWVWVNTSQGTGNNYPLIFEYGVGSTVNGVFANFRKDRNTLASYNFGSAGWVYDNTDTNDFSRNTWQHLVWAQDSNSMTHYVNGSQTYFQSKSYGARTCNGNYRMWSDADRYFEGGIGVCRVYNGHTLSSTEVTNNFDVEKSSFGIS